MAVSLDLLFLGTGNATSYEGRATTGFLVNGRYLFDAGSATLQQMKKARVDPAALQAVLISHFHADHFFGLPFLLLEYWISGRVDDLQIVGPPGIEARTEQLLDLAFPGLPRRERAYRRRYTEVADGASGQVAGLRFEAFEVEHVPSLRCFGYRARIGDHTLAYSGDSVMCGGLLKMAGGADVLVLNCSQRSDPVHLPVEEVPAVVAHARAGAKTILSHVDGPVAAARDPRALVASDLERIRV
jgi:ribonuclease BN (tRNA processing enzyme)